MKSTGYPESIILDDAEELEALRSLICILFDVIQRTKSSRVLQRSTVLGTGASVGVRVGRESNLDEPYGLAMRESRSKSSYQISVILCLLTWEHWNQADSAGLASIVWEEC